MQPFTLRSLGVGALVGASFLCATGCSPHIYTRVEKSYPTDSHGPEVLVFQPEETPPPGEILGEITIGDAGMPEALGYEDVLGLARLEVRRIGGNGLHVTMHLKPSQFGSSCHQIEGRMLCFADSVYIPLLSSQLRIRDTCSRLTATGTPPVTFSDLSSSHSQATPTTLSPPPAIASILHTRLTQTRNTFYAHVGYAFIYSKVATPENVSGNPRHGFDFNLGYNCLLKKGWGVGARYSRYSTSLTGTVEGVMLTDHISLQHFGPEVTLQTVKRRWTIGGALGLGYAHYQEKIENLKANASGLGYHLSFNVEYLLGRNIGLGVNITEIGAFFESQLLNGENDLTSAGLHRLSLTGGLRVHF